MSRTFLGRRRSLRIGGAAIAVTVLLTAPTAADDRPTPEQLAFFEKSIRPVLATHCYKCHAADAEKGIKGGLTLDTREGIRRGGDSGPAVVPGDPEGSLLLQAIRHDDEGLTMPPNQPKLPANVIADFTRWIADGAPDPRDGDAPAAATHQAMTAEQAKTFWAFQPPRKAAPPDVKEASWPRTEIDRHILAGLEARGLSPVGDADRRTLLRRASFDLIGLPPRPEEIDAFLNDPAPTPEAFATVVDRLLASPRFGERWGRHWLDVARFAETSGKEVNLLYPFAWQYRDYVIRAFNDDKPYDRFLKEQLAGDLMPAADDRARAEQVIATGYLAIGPKSHNTINPRQFRLDLADEQIDAFSQGMLGLTIACARCHDHKFDPITQKDYYAIAGIFFSTYTRYGTPEIIQNRHATDLIHLPDSIEAVDPARLSDRDREGLRRQLAQLVEVRDGLVREANEKRDPSILGANIRFLLTISRIATLEKRLSYYREDGRPRPLAMGVQDRFNPGDIPLYVRGELDRPGEVVPRGFVAVLTPDGAPTIGGDSSGRLELAEWVASPQNPLTARVMVNRVWQHLFGRGLVPTPDNFGTTGQPPSHPELLDALAVAFVEDGWSVKKLIRRIVTSRAYQLASTFDESRAAVDPDNILIWRMSPVRLEAEAIRDAILAVSGQLDLTPPVGSAVARAGDGPVQTLLLSAFRPGLVPPGGFGQPGQPGLPRPPGAGPPPGPGSGPGPGMGGPPPGPSFADATHRAVYLPVIRDQGIESLDVFDFAEPSLVTGAREDTTVPSQALFLLNSPFVMRQAAAMAGRLRTLTVSDDQRLAIAFETALGRPPTDGERRAITDFFASFPAQPVKPAAAPPPRPFAGARPGPGGFAGGPSRPGTGTIAPPAPPVLPEVQSRDQAAWVAFCQSLFAAAEFRYRY